MYKHILSKIISDIFNFILKTQNFYKIYLLFINKIFLFF